MGGRKLGGERKNGGKRGYKREKWRARWEGIEREREAKDKRERYG
jgi:hypothetical protein